MKLLASGFVLILGCLLALSMSDAKGPSSDPISGNNASGRAKVRPQIGANRLTGQATPHGLSPAPGRGKAMGRVVPDQRLARRQKGQKDKSFDAAETNPEGRRLDSHGLAHDAPRDAMTRALSKRLSQIDKIRDKALETGNFDLLDLADRLELRARRKFDEMMARIDQRRELGKPGVGPPVLLPVVELAPEPDVSETDPSDTDPPSEPTSLPESEVPLDSDLPAEPEIPAEDETAEQ